MFTATRKWDGEQNRYEDTGGGAGDESRTGARLAAGGEGGWSHHLRSLSSSLSSTRLIRCGLARGSPHNSISSTCGSPSSPISPFPPSLPPPPHLQGDGVGRVHPDERAGGAAREGRPRAVHLHGGPGHGGGIVQVRVACAGKSMNMPAYFCTFACTSPRNVPCTKVSHNDGSAALSPAFTYLLCIMCNCLAPLSPPCRSMITFTHVSAVHHTLSPPPPAGP